MPLVYKTPINKIIASFPFASNIRCPKGLVIPNNSLYDQGSFVNDTFKLLSSSQVIQMYNNLMLEPQQIINKLNSCPNCVLFYASNDIFCPIPDSILNQLENVVRVDGLHECFNSVGTSLPFFKRLAKYI